MVAGVFLAVTAALLTIGDDRHEPPAATRILVARAADPSAVVALPHGGFRYAERLSGRIREVDGDGRLRPTPVAVVAVRSSPGQRGLLGLAVDDRGTTFAAWTRRSDGRLVVGRVAPAPNRLVWIGPPSADLANGGHLAFTTDGRLLIGIGDLEQPQRKTDRTSPNGKLLTLDPHGRSDQRPEVVSARWNNPYAFTYAHDGSLWVADNAAGRKPERIGRGDRRDPPMATTGGLRPFAPSALVPLGKDRLGVCGYVGRVMREVRIVGGRPESPGRVLIDRCVIAAAVLADGRVVVTDENAVRVTVHPMI